jgi:phosphotriesterase-related protein
MSRVILGHCDTYLNDPRFMDVVPTLSCNIQVDMFGNSGYEKGFDFTYPSDETRVEGLLELMQNGMLERLTVSQDCGLKTCLRSYGGHGYDYIPRAIVPWLIRRGAQQDWIDQVLIRNPQRLFPIPQTD